MTDPTTQDAQPATGSDFISLLRGRAPKVALTIAAARFVWPYVTQARHWYDNHSTYLIKVDGEDDIYQTLHDWLLQLLPEKEQRALIAWSSRNSHEPVALDSDGMVITPVPKIRLRYDGSITQTVVLDGHKVQVSVSEGVEHGVTGGVSITTIKPPMMTFVVKSLVARDAVLAHMDELLRRQHEQARRRPALRMLTRWGTWTRLDELPVRPLDSVILPNGQLERLVDDVERFLAAEGEYARRAISWHRGHLYEGPPGTGKTSIARALAQHFGMDIWYLPLSDVEHDTNLIRTVSNVSPRSMLLLEDIDVFHAARSRDDDKKTSLSGLLNALDGVATPHGLLTVMTTNIPGVLDSALVRPGRVDLTESFTLAGAEQVARLIGHFYDTPVTLTKRAVSLLDESPIAPSDVVELCKRHNSSLDAIGALLSLLRD